VDTLRETKFCIEAGRKFVEKEKERKFQNKLTFDYSLAKISREKYRWFYVDFTVGLFPLPLHCTRVSVLPIQCSV
jgi:hypothetical protein